MAENNTSNTPSATPSAAGGKRFIFPAVSCLLAIVIFLALFFGSVILYRKAAKKGVPEAQFAYGMHFKYGTGVKRNIIEAWNLWRKAAPKLEEDRAAKRLADSAGDIENAAKAENADARVQLVWSACLAYGWGVDQNSEEARNWHRKAIASAASQTPEIQYETAMTCSVVPFFYGEIEPEDAAKLDSDAFNLFKMAAEKDFADAQFELAKCYRNGKGVEQDDKAAATWFEKAAEQGVVEAQFELAKCHREGKGVKKDEAVAFTWFQKAARQKYADAQFELANCYRNGKGVEKDDAAAEKWFRKAADQGHSEAKRILKKFYDNKEE